jgi:DNA-binding NtrC family response regulator
MSLRMQALLLRFLENGEIQRVGAERVTVVNNVRVVTATNRNLVERITAGEFREDLFYRLNVIHMVIPPLRDRRDDVVPIWQHCVRLFTQKAGISMPVTTPPAQELLEAYHWPGNVRELRNVVERVCYRAPAIITPALLPAELRVTKPQVAVSGSGEAGVAAAPVAVALMRRMVDNGESFWDVAYAPFMTRDLTREDLRQLIFRGLEQTRGSYKALVRAFNIEAHDYRRFLNFLRKYDCHMPFQRFRMLPPNVERDQPDQKVDQKFDRAAAL